MTPQEKIYAIKERIQDLDDEKNLLIVESLKQYGWHYTNDTPSKHFLWSKVVKHNGEFQRLYMLQDQAWSLQLVLTLNSADI
jgi:hypothetical protein